MLLYSFYSKFLNVLTLQLQGESQHNQLTFAIQHPAGKMLSALINKGLRPVVALKGILETHTQCVVENQNVLFTPSICYVNV